MYYSTCLYYNHSIFWSNLPINQLTNSHFIQITPILNKKMRHVVVASSFKSSLTFFFPAHPHTHHQPHLFSFPPLSHSHHTPFPHHISIPHSTILHISPHKHTHYNPSIQPSKKQGNTKQKKNYHYLPIFNSLHYHHCTHVNSASS